MKKETGSLIGVEKNVRETWDVYVGNMLENVKEGHVVEYMKRNEVEVRSCHLMTSKFYGT